MNIITDIENRDRTNRYLQNRCDAAARDLAEAQRKLADKLSAGELATWSDLETLAGAQAAASIWANVAQIKRYWEEHPEEAPERADLVEAAHEHRMRVLSETVNYDGGRSTNGMSNALEQAEQKERREFLRRTALIYPDDSPLQRLGL